MCDYSMAISMVDRKNNEIQIGWEQGLFAPIGFLSHEAALEKQLLPAGQP
jgi:hypothetical protein